MSFSRLLMLLLCLLALGGHGSSIFAQTNPPVAACGMPAEGTIWQSVTYTLSADCVLTGKLSIPSSNPARTVTINGGGHTVTGGAHNFFLISPGATLNLNSLTLDGESKSSPGIISGSGATVNLNQVTIKRGRSPSVVTLLNGSLNNVLIEENLATSFGITEGGVISVKGNGSATLNNVVLRNNLGGSGAIRVEAGATLTATGCLTSWGNAPLAINGAFTDNSTGACTGAIGNGDAATATAPGVMTCGLPEPGTLVASATYTLTSDCAWDTRSIIAEGVAIRIIGNGHRITSSSLAMTLYTAYTANLELENVALEGIRITNWGDISANRLRVSNTLGFILNGGTISVTDGLFDTNRVSRHASVMLTYGTYTKGQMVFNNAAFRENSGGLGVLVAVLDPSAIELNGCITFVGNSAPDTFLSSATLTDNRAADCDTEVVDPVSPPVLCNPHCDLPPPPVKCNPHCHLIPEECDLKLGAIGLICRPRVQPPVATVWRIRPNTEDKLLPAEGTYLLAVDQPQVEAVAEGLVACSADGRLSIRTGLAPEIRHFFEIDPHYQAELTVPRRYIVFSKGPNIEGKVHHVVLDNAMDGRVFGIVDTFGGPPAAECVAQQSSAPSPAAQPSVQYAPFVQQQTPQADGSIVHIVRPGDTINAIAVAYDADPLELIIFNQLEHMGRWIYPGQELLVRAAGG